MDSLLMAIRIAVGFERWRKEVRLSEYNLEAGRRWYVMNRCTTLYDRWLMGRL